MAHKPMAAVHLPLSDYLDLEFHLLDTRPGVKSDDFVAELIQRWLAIETERLALRQNGPAIRGFQWKNVFLPDGTNLRTTYRQTAEFAKVIGNRICADGGGALTPSQFANQHAKGRNAWRFVWLRFPGDEQWVRAADYRRHLATQRSKAGADQYPNSRLT